MINAVLILVFFLLTNNHVCDYMLTYIILQKRRKDFEFGSFYTFRMESNGTECIL